MSLSDDWNRWINASLFDFFKTNLTPLYLEGDVRNTNTNISNYEIQLDGITWEDSSFDEFKGTLTVRIVCSAVVGTDLYTLQRMMGLASKWMLNSINIIQAGDSGDHLGCLTRVSEIRARSYGLVNPPQRLMQGVIEADYAIDLQGV